MTKRQSPTDVDVAGAREACKINLFGQIQITITFLPLVLKSSKAKIFNISTGMALITYQARPDSCLHVVAHNTSKDAANWHILALANELGGKAIANALALRFTTTKLNGYATGPGAKITGEAAALKVDFRSGLWRRSQASSDLMGTSSPGRPII